MDETKEITQDTDLEDKGQGTPPEKTEKSPSEKGGTTPQAPTLTKEQEKLVTDRVTAELARAGRTAKELEKREQAVRDAEAEMANTKWEIELWDVASKRKLDATVLKEKLEKLGISEKAKAEEIAELMVHGKPTFKPDSGKTIGGISPSTADDKLKEGFKKLNK